MKRMVCALLCGVLLTTLSACGGEEQDSTETKNPEEAVTFTDDLGREVTLAKPRRVAALIGSFADVWCLAGGQGTLVAAADDSWTQFDLDLPETVENLGAVKEPNVEKLLAAEPDFVLGSTKTAADVELLDLLEQSGIGVAYFDISEFWGSGYKPDEIIDIVLSGTDYNNAELLYQNGLSATYLISK